MICFWFKVNFKTAKKMIYKYLYIDIYIYTICINIDVFHVHTNSFYKRDGRMVEELTRCDE